jgi:ribosomal protein S18 acetylase RimI-like enzyme
MGGNGALDWRPIGPGDAAGWAGLMNVISAADRDWEYFSEQDLLEDFSDPYLDFARGSMAAYHEGTMAGYGLLACRTSAEPVHEMRYHGGVHPAYPGRPVSLSGSCLSHNAAAVALYAAHGYRPSRWFHGMTRDLSAAIPEAPAPAGVDVVGLTPDRWEDARLIRNDALRDHWGSTEDPADAWEHSMAISALRPALSFLAYSGGEPLGLVISHEYEAYNEAVGGRDLYVALVATRRAGRKRGIASALLVRALTGAQAAGFTSASLGVDADSPTGALGLYQRAGFTVQLTSITHMKPLLTAQPGGKTPRPDH